MSQPSRAASGGLFYAVIAFTAWGILPLYWKVFEKANPLEVVAHRVIWSLLLLIALVARKGQMREAFAVLRRGKAMAVLLTTAILLSANWALFIYGVATKQVVQTSLGYFLCPLLTIFLGAVFLKERFHAAQKAAIALAALGVFLYGWHLGGIPWVAIGLAVSFSFYGLLHKAVSVEPLNSLLVETALMTPPAVAVSLFLHETGRATFGISPTITLLFLGTGVITTLPLLWFNKAGKRLPLSTLGILQYLTPTFQLLVGVVIFREAFPTQHLFAFALIWGAIALYLKTMVRVRRTVPPA